MFYYLYMSTKNNTIDDREFIPKSEFDEILDAIHDDILIVNGDGIITHASSTFEKVYGLDKNHAIGKNVADLEKDGYFRPSVTAIVLKRDEKVTMAQKNKAGRDIVVTASPVHDENGRIKQVVSYSRDVTDYFNLEKQYSELETKFERYKTELAKLRSESVSNESIITVDKKTKDIMNTINRVANFDTNVLITGESGVGKTLFASSIHLKSPRANGPFIDINCGAIPANLLESELFGYEGGSFTGAQKEGKVGLIESANGGTLFLDEIGELPLNLQVKILKVIQEKVITRVGGVQTLPVDFRLIAATNQNLECLMQKGLFREDLYYRLNVISIEVPPLRECREDILPLTTYLVDQINAKNHISKTLSQEVYNVLYEYDWPGNVRELENVLERILITSENHVIEINDLPKTILNNSAKDKPASEQSLTDAVEKLEAEYVKAAFEKTGTTVGVAKELKISQPTAVRKIRKYIHK